MLLHKPELISATLGLEPGHMPQRSDIHSDQHFPITQITFADMAFLRFVVMDTSTSHVVSQRIIPFSSLRPGYRHLRLRSQSNQPLELATLFIYSKTEEDLLEGRNGIDISQTAAASGKRMSPFTKIKELSDASKEIKDVGVVGFFLFWCMIMILLLVFIVVSNIIAEVRPSPISRSCLALAKKSRTYVLLIFFSSGV